MICDSQIADMWGEVKVVLAFLLFHGQNVYYGLLVDIVFIVVRGKGIHVEVSVAVSSPSPIDVVKSQFVHATADEGMSAIAVFVLTAEPDGPAP